MTRDYETLDGELCTRTDPPAIPATDDAWDEDYAAALVWLREAAPEADEPECVVHGEPVA